MSMTRIPTYHPTAELLAGYGSGALDSATSLVVATHLTYCQACREEVARYEAIGGALLETADPVALSTGCFDAVMASLDGDLPALPVKGEPIRVGDPQLIRLPSPVREFALDAAERDGWRTLYPGIKALNLDENFHKREDETEAQLLKLSPGVQTPRHSHGGMEYTLVLSGAFKDETGLYQPGDLSVASPELTHRPVAQDGESCIALAVTTAPLRLTGFMGFLQRTMGG